MYAEYQDGRGTRFYVDSASYDNRYVNLLNLGDIKGHRYDFIVLKVKGDPGLQYGWAGLSSLSQQDVDTITNDKWPVSLVGYSKFTQNSCLDTPCEQSPVVNSPNCYLTGVIPTLNMASHDCDDAIGVSGASLQFPTKVGVGDYGNAVAALSTIDVSGKNAAVQGGVFYNFVVKLIEESRAGNNFEG